MDLIDSIHIVRMQVVPQPIAKFLMLLVFLLIVFYVMYFIRPSHFQTS